MSTLSVATKGFLDDGAPLCIATHGFICADVVTGGGSFTYDGVTVSDPRYLDFLYKPQEPLIETIEEIETDVEFEQPDQLIQRIPVEFRAPQLHDIEDEIEREIASLMRIIAIQKHAARAVDQAKKEALFNKNKQVMLMLILEES